MGAKLAVIGVIHRDQRIDAGISRGRELVRIQLALVGGECSQIIAHQPDRRLAEIDQFDAGHRGQYLRRCFHHAGRAGVAMKRDPHVHRLA
jgi:hypothetical protein